MLLPPSDPSSRLRIKSSIPHVVSKDASPVSYAATHLLSPYKSNCLCCQLSSSVGLISILPHLLSPRELQIQVYLALQLRRLTIDNIQSIKRPVFKIHLRGSLAVHIVRISQPSLFSTSTTYPLQTHQMPKYDRKSEMIRCKNCLLSEKKPNKTELSINRRSEKPLMLPEILFISTTGGVGRQNHNFQSILLARKKTQIPLA